MCPSWLKQLFPKKSRPASRRRPARVRLGLEALEAREVPSARRIYSQTTQPEWRDVDALHVTRTGPTKTFLAPHPQRR
jgi:hypothetical protein